MKGNLNLLISMAMYFKVLWRRYIHIIFTLPCKIVLQQYNSTFWNRRWKEGNWGRNGVYVLDALSHRHSFVYICEHSVHLVVFEATTHWGAHICSAPSRNTLSRIQHEENISHWGKQGHWAWHSQEVTSRLSWHILAARLQRCCSRRGGGQGNTIGDG